MLSYTEGAKVQMWAYIKMQQIKKKYVCVCVFVYHLQRFNLFKCKHLILSASFEINQWLNTFFPILTNVIIIYNSV